MNDVELAWVAGLLEGEGCFYCAPYPKRKVLQTRVNLLMADKDIVERYASLVQVTARVWEIVHVGVRANRRNMYGAALYGHAAIRLMKAVLPHMGQRRSSKIREILMLWDFASHRREPNLPATCHPDRKHQALGLCKGCYEIQRKRKKGSRGHPIVSIRKSKPWEGENMSRRAWYAANRNEVFKDNVARKGP